MLPTMLPLAWLSSENIWWSGAGPQLSRTWSLQEPSTVQTRPSNLQLLQATTFLNHVERLNDLIRQCWELL